MKEKNIPKINIDVKANAQQEMKESIKSNVVRIPLKGQNFGLSKTEFVEMTLMLKDGVEELFEQIFLSHFEDCIQYLVRNYRIERELAYDITMDTLIQFREKLLNDKIQYGNLRFLFTKMASQNLFKNKRKNKKVDPARFYLMDETIDNESILKVLNKSWSELDESSKKVLESYYYQNVSLISFAQQNGISDSTMRKKKQRSVEKLRKIFFKNYKSYE